MTRSAAQKARRAAKAPEREAKRAERESARRRRKTPPPICAECGKEARLVSGEGVYPHRQDLWSLMFWCCDCGARCGCHKGTIKPLGTPCGPETRRLRSAAHAAFDPLWRRKMARDGCTQGEARGAAYGWLGGQLGLPPELVHIGMFNAETCRRVLELCEPYQR